MDEKIELYNNAIKEKDKEFQEKMDQLKINKEKSVESLLKDKKQLEKELEKIGLESYIVEEYKNDLTKVNDEIESQENILEEKVKELEYEREKAEKSKDVYSNLNIEKKKEEEKIQINNKKIESLKKDKISLEQELENYKLEGYIRDEYNKDLIKVNSEINFLMQANEESNDNINVLTEKIENLEKEYEIDLYMQKQEEIKRLEKQKEIEENEDKNEEKQIEENEDKIQEKIVENVEKVEPTKTEPVKAEPVKAEPVKAEPVKTEPVKAEPVKAEPVKAEPVKTEPVKTEPVKAEPTKAETIKDELKYKYVKIIISKNGLTVRAPGLNKKEGLDEVNLDLNELKDEITNWKEKYNEEVFIGRKLNDEQFDNVDYNILVALGVLYKSDIDKEMKTELISRYGEAIVENGNVSKDKSLKGIIEYDRTDLDYLKPRNLISRIIHKKQFDEMKYGADVAEKLGIAEIKQDEPGKIRKFFSNMKNKIPLFANKETKMLEDGKKSKETNNRKQTKNGKALLEAMDKYHDGKIDYQGEVATGIHGKIKDFKTNLKEMALSGNDEEEAQYYYEKDEKINENKERANAFSIHVTISDGDVQTKENDKEER